jgi:hypothetical protein
VLFSRSFVSKTIVHVAVQHVFYNKLRPCDVDKFLQAVIQKNLGTIIMSNLYNTQAINQSNIIQVPTTTVEAQQSKVEDAALFALQKVRDGSGALGDNDYKALLKTNDTAFANELISSASQFSTVDDHIFSLNTIIGNLHDQNLALQKMEDSYAPVGKEAFGNWLEKVESQLVQYVNNSLSPFDATSLYGRTDREVNELIAIRFPDQATPAA